MEKIDFKTRLTFGELIATCRALQIAGANDSPANINDLAKRLASFWYDRTNCKRCGHSVTSFDFDEEKQIITFNTSYDL